MQCRNCRAELPGAVRFCPMCATPVGDPAIATKHDEQPMASIDFRRLGTGDFIVGGATIILFISLFLSWYSISFSASSASISALGSGAGGWRVLILILCLCTVGYLFARTLWPRPRLPIPHWQLLTVTCGITALLTLLAFLVRPGSGSSSLGISISWAYGAYIGLVAAIAAVAGAVQRSKQPEVIHSIGSPSGPQSAHPMAPAAASGPQPTGVLVCRQCVTTLLPGNQFCTTCGGPGTAP